jgi:23S rRNA pseudouridine1911/1915/1917 synthase
MASTLTFTVPDDLDGERLDKALAVLLDLSRSVARGLLDEGVQLEGTISKPNARVRTGDQIITPTPTAPEELAPEPVDFDVLYVDDDVVVVNKAPGMVVHPGAGQRSGTLAAGLLHRYPEVRGVGASGRWGLIHRLDKDTSGALLVARNEPAFQALSRDLKAREIGREYVALVAGTMSPPSGTIEAAIGRDVSAPTRRAVTPDGKPARTHYRVIRNYEEAGVALVSVRLETGRTHQIRVHFLAIGHPLIGDRTYNLTPIDVTSPRVFLHAGRLSFTHPGTGEPMSVEAPLPADLAGVVHKLDHADRE